MGGDVARGGLRHGEHDLDRGVVLKVIHCLLQRVLLSPELAQLLDLWVRIRVRVRVRVKIKIRIRIRVRVSSSPSLSSDGSTAGSVELEKYKVKS